MGPQARKVLDDKFIMYMDAYPYWAAKIDTFKSTGHLDALLQGMYMARNVSNLLTPDELDFTSFARRAKISSTALHLLAEQQGCDKPRPSAT